MPHGLPGDSGLDSSSPLVGEGLREREFYVPSALPARSVQSSRIPQDFGSGSVSFLGASGAVGGVGVDKKRRRCILLSWPNQDFGVTRSFVLGGHGKIVGTLDVRMHCKKGGF